LHKNLTPWFKRYELPLQYTLKQEVSYTSPAQDHAEPYIVTDVCIHNSENTNN